MGGTSGGGRLAARLIKQESIRWLKSIFTENKVQLVSPRLTRCCHSLQTKGEKKKTLKTEQSGTVWLLRSHDRVLSRASSRFHVQVSGTSVCGPPMRKRLKCKRGVCQMSRRSARLAAQYAGWIYAAERSVNPDWHSLHADDAAIKRRALWILWPPPHLLHLN